MPASRYRFRTAPRIAVLTCDRAGAFYLGDTLSQIDTEGGAPLERVLYVEGSQDFAKRLETWLETIKHRGWTVVHLGEKLGGLESMRRLLRMESVHGKDLLFFEDDLELCKNAVQRMAELEVPSDTWLVSFFDAKELSQDSPMGIHRRLAHGLQTPGLRGTQAIKFKASAVRCLAEADWSPILADQPFPQRDQRIGAILSSQNLGSRIGIHIPHLVQDLDQSTSTHSAVDLEGRPLVDIRFPGREFDALSLPPMS
ncbi:MAG TPA: hypothetical protein PKO15_02440 [Fibrobacteria bacterium]|nr:hypothetical protein [Fibrobacteria bacterium]